MPLYEYHCPSCNEEFEELVSPSETPSCPRCGASDPEKLLSAHNVGGSAPVPSGCGRCGDPRGPGACRFD